MKISAEKWVEFMMANGVTDPREIMEEALSVWAGGVIEKLDAEGGYHGESSVHFDDRVLTVSARLYTAGELKIG